MLRVQWKSVFAFRARASHLDTKVELSELGAAARGGLQDSAPRAGVISLHARVANVSPDVWEDPALVQIWGPRGADYLVPRVDVAIFTLGRLSRDPEQQRNANAIVDHIENEFGRTMTSTREVTTKLGLGHEIRGAATTGRLHIRWDASKIWVIPVPAPDVDADQARIELARRFFGWFGPISSERFVWWAGVDEADAAITIDRLLSELMEVEVEGTSRLLLRESEERLRLAEPILGVRLIPHSDPYIKIDGKFMVEDPNQRLEAFPLPRRKTEFWPVAGAIVRDGDLVGSWNRRGRHVTVNPWDARLSAGHREAIQDEAMSLPIPGTSPPSFDWTR